MPENPAEDLSRIALVVLDVDGVLTDGGVGITPRGEEIKFFCVADGLAIRLAQQAGLRLAFLSGRSSPCVARRARELGVERVIQGSSDKLSDLERLVRELGLDLGQTAYMGDDLPDLPVMRSCGFSAAPAGAAPEVLQAARFVCQRPGGKGAVREFIEGILKAQGKWAGLLKAYLP